MPQLFWYWKAPPPRPARPKAPHGMSFMQIPCHVIHGHDATVMARHPVFRHDMSYMDMPWSWHVMPCSHFMWPWHDKLHMKQVMLPTHVQPFISWRLVSKFLSVSKSWPPLSPCGENVKRWNLQWHWTLPHVWVLLPSTALFGQLPSHLGAIKLWGPIPPSRFLQISSLLSWSLAVPTVPNMASMAKLHGWQAWNSMCGKHGLANWAAPIGQHHPVVRMSLWARYKAPRWVLDIFNPVRSIQRTLSRMENGIWFSESKVNPQRWFRQGDHAKAWCSMPPWQPEAPSAFCPCWCSAGKCWGF